MRGGNLLNLPTGTVPVPSLRISDGFFRTLGLTPALGRDFQPGEDLPNTASLVILSFEGWQKWFAGRPDILGQKVTLMRKLLFGTAACDLPTLAAVALVPGASAMLASYLPARRAAGVNPVEVLRSE